MPNETDNNKGAGGDDAAAKAAADRSAADAAAAAAAAVAGNGGGSGDDEEIITIKRSDLKKIEFDRDNYKKGLLQKKADERDLHDGDGKGGGGDGAGAGHVIDEKKVGEVATAATNKVLRDASEKTAKRAFLKAHPEYVDDAQWISLMSHLTFKGGELTHDEVVDRMEAALFEHKRSTGRLEEHLKAEHERGVREGRIQEQTGSGQGTGGAGDKNEGKGTGTLSPKGEEMARAMHVDPEKVKKVDTSKDNVIDVTK
jgi:hypothetical protein